MKHRTVRKTALAALAVGIALTQQGCANGAPSTPVPTPAKSGASHTAQPVATRKSPATSRRGSVVACRSDDMAVDVIFQTARDDGDRMALLAVTNRSARTCWVKGTVTFALTTVDGDIVDVPTTVVDEPGPAVRITLKSGRTAWQGIKWRPCKEHAANCASGTGMSFTLDGAADGPDARLVDFPAAEKNPITMESLTVGTIQPITQAVVAW